MCRMFSWNLKWTENQLCKLWDVKDVIKYTRYKHNGTEQKTFMGNFPKCSSYFWIYKTVNMNWRNWTYIFLLSKKDEKINLQAQNFLCQCFFSTRKKPSKINKNNIESSRDERSLKVCSNNFYIFSSKLFHLYSKKITIIHILLCLKAAKDDGW